MCARAVSRRGRSLATRPRSTAREPIGSRPSSRPTMHHEPRRRTLAAVSDPRRAAASDARRRSRRRELVARERPHGYFVPFSSRGRAGAAPGSRTTGRSAELRAAATSHAPARLAAAAEHETRIRDRDRRAADERPDRHGGRRGCSHHGGIASSPAISRRPAVPGGPEAPPGGPSSHPATNSLPKPSLLPDRCTGQSPWRRAPPGPAHPLSPYADPARRLGTTKSRTRRTIAGVPEDPPTLPL